MNPDNALAIAVDIGGTFTDIALHDASSGRIWRAKTPSMPSDPSQAFLTGIRLALDEAGKAAPSLARVLHGTTVATNMILEGKGAKAALVTTAGFRHVLTIGRQDIPRRANYLAWVKPARPVPASRVLEVKERIGAGGVVIEPLDEASVETAAIACRKLGVEAVAVCLLHSFANPAHERKVADMLRARLPGVAVTASSDVLPVVREYERSLATVFNAVVMPGVSTYVSRLEKRLLDEHVSAPLLLMQSNGGVAGGATIRRAPALTALSGPAAGVVGARDVADACGIRDIITVDIGGTSADICLIKNGTIALTQHGHVGEWPLPLPMVDMVTIGAGGGSIAWVEGGFGLRVGPHSAGSVPGPACYAQGGGQPTVTDANLVLGRLNASYFLGGARSLDLARATDAIRTRVAEPLGMTTEAAAFGIIAIAEAHMADAIRLVSVERGLDPRDFTLVAFGGAGPLHAVRLAEALSIGNVLVPPAPGNLSAMGLLCADVRHDLARTLLHRLTADFLPRVRAIYVELVGEADAALASDGVPAIDRECTLAADLRYQGQNYELTIPVSDDDLARGFGELVLRFNDQHRRIYGYQLSGREVQLVNARVTAVGRTRHAHWPVGAQGASAKPLAARSLLVEPGARVDAPVYRFDDLSPEQGIAGPSIVEYRGSTLFLPTGWQARIDARRNAHLVREAVAQSTPPRNMSKETA